MNKILLDTHILIWSLTKSEELSFKTKEIIKDAKTNKSLYISSITLWEIAMLASKQRINIFKPTNDFLSFIESIKGLNIIPISANIAAESVMLPGTFHCDPADKIIVASARCMGAILITQDQKILDWAKIGYLRVWKD